MHPFGRTYLDYAASAPCTPRARRAFMVALKAYGNPSSPHEEGRKAKAVLEAARSVVAHETGAKPESVIFTAGATEANNLAILGYIRALQASGTPASSMHVLYHPGAHISLVRPVTALTQEGISIEPLALKEGAFDIERIKTQIRKETCLVAIEGLSSETGMRYDARGLRQILDEARPADAARIVLLVDASALPSVESIERTRLGADLMTLDAQKIGGVRGIGAIIRSSAAALAPLYAGGGQEGGFRPGTEAPALAAAFAEALGEARAQRDAFSVRSEAMRAELIAAITSLPNVFIQGGKRHAPHIVNVSFCGRDTDYLVALLDARGFSVATKSACETDSTEGSRAVMVETGKEARAASTLRISWGPKTSHGTLRRFARALAESVAFLDQNPV